VSRARILCVDDEKNVLEGLQRLLRKDYEVSIALGGAAALAFLDNNESFAVVISDMRMPSMSGAELLGHFRRRAPDTVRLLLTGHTDLDSAILAVNDGQIFRFLTKPCPPETLATTIASAITQHRLITSEKVLLEHTLVGTIRALAEVLALSHPEAFGAVWRRHSRARSVAEKLGLADAWHVEVASMLAAVGYVVLPGDVTVKLHAGQSLDNAELGMAEQIPEVIERVLSHIPRLEKVRDVLKHSKVAHVAKAPARSGTVPLGARILDALQDLAVLEVQQGDTLLALKALQEAKNHDAALLAAIAAVCEQYLPEIRALELKEVRVGYVLATDVKAVKGALLVSGGQAVTPQLLQRLRNFHVRGGVAEPIVCEVPRAPPEATPVAAPAGAGRLSAR
jgi:FixJ family two-component response regulator